MAPKVPARKVPRLFDANDLYQPGLSGRRDTSTANGGEVIVGRFDKECSASVGCK